MKKHLTLALMMSLLAPVGVMAQDSSSGSSSDTSTTSGGSSATPSTSGAFVTMPDPSAWRVSALEQADVYSSEGEKIGKITDIMVNQNGNVSAVLIGVGEFLGSGNKDVAVAMTALTFQPMSGSGASASSGSSSGDSSLTTGSTTTTTPSTDSSAASGTSSGTSSDTTASSGTSGTTTGDTASSGTSGTTTGDTASSGTATGTTDTQTATGGATTTGSASDVASSGASSGSSMSGMMVPERIVLNVTRAELESAPAFDASATTGQQ